MLEAVIQQVHLRAEGCFSGLACLAPVFANNDVNPQLASYQQGLVAKVARGALWIDDSYTLRPTPVSA